MSKLTAVDDAYVDDTVTFASLGLDPRISEAVVQLGFKNPTLIQSKAIPLALEEKCDIIAKASTGSGKTAAYLIPIIQTILDEYAAEGIISNNDGSHQFKAVILVPTKELSNQVASFCKLLLKNCGNLISLLNLADSYTPDVLKALIASKPEILITTPNKFLKLIENDDSLVDLSELQQTLRFICLDEVDLIFSYGYQEDLDKIVELLNIGKLNIQSFSMSATLNDEITSTIKTKFCKTPKVLKLNDDEVTKNKDKLIQYYIKTSEFDKFLMTFVILKLNLIKGKILVFVNNIERGYRLKLFLEQFGIKGCILNSELPINSRLHIIDQYNKNYYNLLIATDDSHGLEVDEREVQEAEEEEDVEVEQQQQKEEEQQEEEEEEQQQQQQQQSETVPQPNATKQNTKQNSKKKRDNEFGVSRGVDFKNVACVLNFDLPTTSKNYVHRIGRTARANKSGIALSYVVNSKDWGKHKQSSLLTAKKDEKIFQRILNKQQKIGLDVIPYKFNSSHLESFRYRVEDAFRAVTGTAIREARIREIKQEILTSEKLKRHFEENPQDLEALRHDKELHAARAQPHLKNIPNYLLPDSLKKNAKAIGFVPLNKPNRKRQRGGKNGKKGGSGKKRKSNPLKTFRAK